jgi:hypothetical protein
MRWNLDEIFVNSVAMIYCLLAITKLRQFSVDLNKKKMDEMWFQEDNLAKKNA